MNSPMNGPMNGLTSICTNNSQSDNEQPLFTQHPDKLANIPPDEILAMLRQLPIDTKFTTRQLQTANLWMLPWVHITLQRREVRSILELQSVWELISNFLVINDSVARMIDFRFQAFYDLLEIRRRQLVGRQVDSLAQADSTLHQRSLSDAHNRLLDEILSGPKTQDQLVENLQLSKARVQEMLMTLESRQIVIRERVVDQTVVHLHKHKKGNT